MKLLKMIWAALVVSLPCSLLAASPQTLADYKTIYDREVSAINTNNGAIEEAARGYAKMLDSLEATFKKAGDYDATITVLAEKKQFALCRMVPQTTPPDTPSDIVKAQDEYRRDVAKAVAAKDARLVKLTQQYLKVLKEHIRTLLEKNEIDEAEEVNKEIQRAQVAVKDLIPADSEKPKEAIGLQNTSSETDHSSTSMGVKKKWELMKGFSLTSNPNGAWSFGWTQETGGKFMLYRKSLWSAELKRNTGWTSGDKNSPGPHAWMNSSNKEICRVRPGQLSLHPGPGGQHSIARWTSPGRYHVMIEGEFCEGDLGAMSVQVLHNGKPLFQAENTSKKEVFALEANIKSGDTIDFDVGTGHGGWGWGNTPITAVISTK